MVRAQPLCARPLARRKDYSRRTLPNPNASDGSPFRGNPRTQVNLHAHVDAHGSGHKERWCRRRAKKAMEQVRNLSRMRLPISIQETLLPSLRIPAQLPSPGRRAVSSPVSSVASTGASPRDSRAPRAPCRNHSSSPCCVRRPASSSSSASVFRISVSACLRSIRFERNSRCRAPAASLASVIRGARAAAWRRAARVS